MVQAKFTKLLTVVIGTCRRIGRKVSIVIVFAIYVVFPCHVEALQFRFIQEGFKQDFSFFMSKQNLRCYYFGDQFGTHFAVLSKGVNDIYESGAKDRSTLIELSSADSFDTATLRKEMVSKTDNKPACNNTEG